MVLGTVLTEFPAPLGQLTENLLMLRETVFFFLGEDQLTVHLHFKDPAAGFNQFRLYPDCLLNCFRQTGGLGVVVSLHTIFNGNFLCHGCLLMFWLRTKIR